MLFDVFFVTPHLSLTVADAQYLVTFAVMLAVGLITTHLTAQFAERREKAQARAAPQFAQGAQGKLDERQAQARSGVMRQGRGDLPGKGGIEAPERRGRSRRRPPRFLA